MNFEHITETAKLFKILGDPTRLKIVEALRHHELCVCDIGEVLSISQSLTSHQLKKLRDAGIVKRRKEGPTIYYSIKDDHVLDIYLNALEHTKECC